MYKEKYLKYKTKYLELKNQLDGISNIIQDGGGRSWFWPLSWSTQDNPNIEIEKTESNLNITEKKNNIPLYINRHLQTISIQISLDNEKEMDTNYQNTIAQLTNEKKLIYKKLFQIAINQLDTVYDEDCINKLNEYIIDIDKSISRK
jgi:hypothetical protein